MVSITLSVPEEVKHRMDALTEINWSGFIRKAIIDKTESLSWKEEMLEKLKTEDTQWAVGLQKKSRSHRLKELKKKGLL